MRFSLIGLLGTGILGVAVGCGDGEDASAVDASGGSGGKSAGGHAGKGSAGGNHAAGKGGSNNGGSGGSKGGTGGSGGSGTSGSATSGTGGSVGGSTGVGGTNVTSGTGGTLVVEAGNGGQAGEGGAGASSAGIGGAAEAGSGGEPSSAGAGGASDCTGVDPMTRTLDQSQLDMPGSIGLSLTQLPGESFTVGTAGLLTGIEVAVGPCNGADTTGDIQLELFDSQGTSLGHVTLPQSSLPDVCGGDQLVEPSIGAGYFDLTPLCVSAGVGDAFTFILSLTGNAPATCDQSQCSNNNHYCYTDEDCTGFYYVGETNCGGTGCEGAPSAYPGGSEVMQNVDSGALQPEPAFELAFKTFMQ